MKEAIAKELMEHCEAVYVKVVDDSESHQGHRGTDQISDTHFSVCVLSSLFEGKSLVQRHRMIYAICDTFIHQGVHALAIESFTVEEWIKKNG